MNKVILRKVIIKGMKTLMVNRTGAGQTYTAKIIAISRSIACHSLMMKELAATFACIMRTRAHFSMPMALTLSP